MKNTDDRKSREKREERELRRHRLLWKILYALLHRYVRRRFRLTGELYSDGPVLLISNHVTSWDFMMIGAALGGKHIYFVASEHLRRLGIAGRVINWVAAPISRRKAASGLDTAAACVRQLRKGNSVCLFAEGEQSWDGRSIPVFPATGKLAKVSGAALMTCRLEGAYLSLPRWGKGLRKGRVHIHAVNVYTPEQLKKMSAEEVNDAINQDIFEDAWETQRREHVRYRGKAPAEELERFLYLCPACRKIGTLKSKGDTVSCGCGFKMRYTEEGFLECPDKMEAAEGRAFASRKERSPEGAPEGSVPAFARSNEPCAGKFTAGHRGAVFQAHLGPDGNSSAYGECRDNRSACFLHCDLPAWLKVDRSDGRMLFPPVRSTIADWDGWQREALASGAYCREGEACFSDPGISLIRIDMDHSETFLKRGVLTQYEDRLVLQDSVFPLEEIQDMALVLTHRMLIRFRKEYYELRAEKGTNLRKYLEIWNGLRERNRV